MSLTLTPPLTLTATLDDDPTVDLRVDREGTTTSGSNVKGGVDVHVAVKLNGGVKGQGQTATQHPSGRFAKVLSVTAVALLCAVVGQAWAEPAVAAPDATVGDDSTDLATSLDGTEFDDPEVTARLVPPIAPREVVAAAYRAAAIADDPIRSWALRSRLTALIPSLSTRVSRGQSWRDVVDPTLGYRDAWDVRATWRLDRLLFDPNELRLSTVDINRRRERRRVAATAIRLYYRWILAHAAAQAASRDAPRWAVRSGELHAQLDALTEGWFSKALVSAQSR